MLVIASIYVYGQTFCRHVSDERGGVGRVGGERVCMLMTSFSLMTSFL